MGSGGENTPIFSGKLSATQLLSKQNIEQQEKIAELKAEIRRLKREDRDESCESLSEAEEV